MDIQENVFCMLNFFFWKLINWKFQYPRSVCFSGVRGDTFHILCTHLSSATNNLPNDLTWILGPYVFCIGQKDTVRNKTHQSSMILNHLFYSTGCQQKRFPSILIHQNSEHSFIITQY